MKVKIGRFIFDTEDEPIMLILDDSDKHNIASMIPEAHKFCSCPEGITQEEALQFMHATATKVKMDPLVPGELIYLD